LPAAASLQLQRRYTRSDPRGAFPRLAASPDIEHNRLAMFWRPLIDMTDSALAPMHLRMISPVSGWLSRPEPGRRSWFAMIAVAGLRHQVVRHAGLDRYDCREPTGLTEQLRTPQWNTLLDAIARFRDLDDGTRALLVFQLAQLSYCQYVFTLAGVVRPNGDPEHDRYAYEVARVHARYPGHTDRALEVYDALAEHDADPLLALASCAQGISNAIRGAQDTALGRSFETRGQRAAARLADQWHSWLVISRFHRAVALLRMAERDADGMQHELHAATTANDRLSGSAPEDTDALVALENSRILAESKIKAAGRAPTGETARQVRAWSRELADLDPNCPEARIIAGDGYVTAGDYAQAAVHYVRAGELGTTAGAMGWYRAGQCFDALGDRGNAVNAMARCLELDASAIEPRKYLEGHGAAPGGVGAYQSPPVREER
jgi:tetratricopeptide (TPR) repeat protein